MGSLTRVTRTGTVGTCNTKSSNLGHGASDNNLQYASSPSPSSSSSQSTNSSSDCHSESTSDDEESDPSYSKLDAAAVMKKRKLMDARCFRAIFSGGFYTKKIKLTHDNDHNDEEAGQVSVPGKLFSPTSGENVGTTPTPTCRIIVADKDPEHEFSRNSNGGSGNLNPSFSSHKPDNKSDDVSHISEHHLRNTIENGDGPSCEIAAHVLDTSKKPSPHNHCSDTQVDERDVNVGSCHLMQNDIDTLKIVDSGGKSLSPDSARDGVITSSEVTTGTVLQDPAMSSVQLKSNSCDGFYTQVASLSSRGTTTQLVNKNKFVNHTSSESELEEGEIRENPHKNRCQTLQGTGISPNDADLEAKLQSKGRCTESQAVVKQKSLVERAIRERTTRLLAEQMLEKDNFKKFMDLEEIKVKEASAHDHERFAEHRIKQRRKLISLQVLTRNKAKEIHSQWLEDASNGNLSKSFHLIPLPTSGFFPEGFMLSSNVPVCVGDDSHVSEQDRDKSCGLAKSSDISSDQILETKKGDLPSNTSNEISKDVDEVEVMPSKEGRAEMEHTHSNHQPYSQATVQCRQAAPSPSPSHGSSQCIYSDLVCQVPIYEKAALDNHAQDSGQLEQAEAMEQTSLGAALDTTEEPTKKTSPSSKSEGPKSSVENASCKDHILCSSEPDKLALTKIVENQQINVPDELCHAQSLSSSKSLGALMPESIKLASGDFKMAPEQKPRSDPVEVSLHEQTDDDMSSSQGRISSTYKVERGKSRPQNLIAGPESSQVFEDDFLVSDAMGNAEPVDNSAIRVSPTQCVDMSSSQGRISSTYKVERGKSGPQNPIAGPESSQVLEDDFLVSDAMGNTEPVDDSAGRVSPPQCVDMIPPIKFENSVVSSGTKSRQEATATERSLEMRSVANKPSDNSKTSPNNLTCDLQFANGPSTLHEKFSMPDPGDNMSGLDLCAPTTSTELSPTFSCSRPVGVSLSHHVREEKVPISEPLQLPTSQQIQSIPSNQGNSVVPASVDSKQKSSSSQLFPVSSIEATSSYDDVTVLDSCHPTSSPQSSSFAAWVQSDASAPGHSNASAPGQAAVSAVRTLLEKRNSKNSDVGVSSSHHVHEKEVPISVSPQVPTLQQVQFIHSGYGNSIVSAAVDSKQAHSSSQAFPVASFDDNDDDVIDLGSCHPTSSSERLSFAAWVQPDASFPRQANASASGRAAASAPRTKLGKRNSSLETRSANSLDLQVQSFSIDGRNYSGLIHSPAVAMIAPSEHHKGNSCSTTGEGLCSSNAMASNTDRRWLPLVTQTGDIQHTGCSGELAQPVTSQVNELTSNDIVRTPNYHCNINDVQGSTSGVCQPYVMTAQLPFRGILTDPLLNELSRILIEKDVVTKMCTDAKAKLRSEFDIEVEKVKKKYETLFQNAAAEFSEKNRRLDMINKQIQKNQLLANFVRSEIVGYDETMEIIPSLQGKSCGSREQSGSSMGSVTSASAVWMSGHDRPLSDTGIVVLQRQSQSTTLSPVSASVSSASSSRHQFRPGFIPASSMAIPVSTAKNTLYDTARLSQVQLPGSVAYPVAPTGSLASSLKHNFGSGMTLARPALGTVPTSVSSNLGNKGMLQPPTSVPSAVGLRYPFGSTAAIGLISTALNTNPVSAPTRRQQFEPCVASTPSERTVPLSVGSHPGSHTPIFPPLQLQGIVPPPEEASTPLPAIAVHVNPSSSTLMPNSSVAPISSGVPLVKSNSIRSAPPHLRYRSAMPVPRSTAQ